MNKKHFMFVFLAATALVMNACDSDTPKVGSQKDLAKASRSAGTGDTDSATGAGSELAQRDTKGSSDRPRPTEAGKPGASAGRVGKSESGSRSQPSGQAGIRQAQEALKSQGQDPGPIDGIMGPRTRQALRKFQQENGLKQTGTLDAATREKLNIEGRSS